MRIISLGDTHGRPLWKQIIAKEKDCQVIVFKGDYFDNKGDNFTIEQQINNFLDIVAFKESQDKLMSEGNPEAILVIMLFGNHDFHYFADVREKYTMDPPSMYAPITKVLEENKHHLKAAYAQNDYLFTHAGVSADWLAKQVLSKGLSDIPAGNRAVWVADFVNELFLEDKQRFCFTSGELMDEYGNETCQTPIWIRPQALGSSCLVGVHQVVGHTTVDRIVTFPKEGGDTTLTLADTIASGKYVIIEDNILVEGDILD